MIQSQPVAQPVSATEQLFLEAFHAHQKAAERYALSLTGSRDDAKDLLQDAVVIVWKKFAELRDPAAFKSYLFTIITNLFRRRYRRAKRFEPLTIEAEEIIENSEHAADELADLGMLKQAIDKLPPKSKEAILLYEVEDLSVADIAVIQQSSVSAVKVRLMRARSKLKKILDLPAEASSVNTPYSLPMY